MRRCNTIVKFTWFIYVRIYLKGNYATIHQLKKLKFYFLFFNFSVKSKRILSCISIVLLNSFHNYTQK